MVLAPFKTEPKYSIGKAVRPPIYDIIKTPGPIYSHLKGSNIKLEQKENIIEEPKEEIKEIKIEENKEETKEEPKLDQKENIIEKERRERGRIRRRERRKRSKRNS